MITPKQYESAQWYGLKRAYDFANDKQMMVTLLQKSEPLRYCLLDVYWCYIGVGEFKKFHDQDPELQNEIGYEVGQDFPGFSNRTKRDLVKIYLALYLIMEKHMS